MPPSSRNPRGCNVVIDLIINVYIYIYLVPGHEQICLQVVFVQLGPVARKASQNMNFNHFSCSFWGTLQGCRSHIPPNGKRNGTSTRLKKCLFLGDICEFPLGGRNFQFPSFSSGIFSFHLFLREFSVSIFFFGNFQFPSFSSGIFSFHLFLPSAIDKRDTQIRM